MNEPRIPTKLQLHQRDRELLERIKPLIGDTSMSAAASFVFDYAGEQVVAWLEEGFQLKKSPINHQSTTNQVPIRYQSTTNQPPINHQSTTNQPNDAIADLDALLA